MTIAEDKEHQSWLKTLIFKNTLVKNIGQINPYQQSNIKGMQPLYMQFRAVGGTRG